MHHSKRTKHIKVRYFLVKYKIDINKLEVKHISTDIMWYDVLNKSKKVTPFRVFRGAFMNVSEHYDDDEECKNTHTMLLPREGNGAVDSTVFKQIILL